MSTLTVTIAGSNLTSEYQTDSLTISELINNKANTVSFRMSVKSSGTVPQVGSSVSISDSARTPSLLFAGFISRTKSVEYGKGSFFVYQIEATDYTYIFNNRLAARAYTNTTLHDIVVDLLSSYASDQSFNTTNVATGPTIPSVTFNHITLRACFEQLAKLTGYVWWVDYSKNMYVQTSSTTAAPESFKDSAPSNHESVTVDYDTTQTRNSITVTGSTDGQASANSVTQTFTADGTTRSWQLDNKPDSVVGITVNGVAKQISLDVNQQTTDDFTYSFTGSSFAVSSSGSIPTAGQSIVITYYPRVPIIANVQDAASIAFFKAYEGGNGLHEFLINDPAITSKDQARDRGNQELEQYAMPMITGKVITRSDMLGANHIFKPGQALTVNLPSWGISTDTVYLIQQVRTTLSESGSAIIYSYEITFGGKPMGVQEFLEALAQSSTSIDSQTVETIVAAGVDSATASEHAAPTKTTYTPPFQYGAGGSPQGVWGKSEWA